MEKTFLQKNLLTKSLSKLLLLVLLTFSGCEMFRDGFGVSLNIPSSGGEPMPILSSFEGKMWEVPVEDLYNPPCMFVLYDDTTTYTHIYEDLYMLEYKKGGYDWATYEGDDDNSNKIRVEMTNITTNGTMDYTRYKNDSKEIATKTAKISQ